MQPKPLKPRKAINKGFLKIKPNRTEIEWLKSNLIELLDRTNDTESEEFHKNLVSDFLRRTSTTSPTTSSAFAKVAQINLFPNAESRKGVKIGCSIFE